MLLSKFVLHIRKICKVSMKRNLWKVNCTRARWLQASHCILMDNCTGLHTLYFPHSNGDDYSWYPANKIFFIAYSFEQFYQDIIILSFSWHWQRSNGFTFDHLNASDGRRHSYSLCLLTTAEIILVSIRFKSKFDNCVPICTKSKEWNYERTG